MKCWIR